MEFDKSQYMEDRKGSLVPIALVKEIDILRNNLVMEIVEKAKKLNAVLRAFKIDVMADVAAFVELSAEKYNERYGGDKGNVQLLSYDGKFKIVRSVADYIVFDERLQIAKKMIDECIAEWLKKGSCDEIIVLVNGAFEVDKAGKLRKDEILGLRRHNIDDPKWKKAMDAISDSIQVTGSKPYIRIYEQKDGEKYEQISLDVASL